MESKAAQSTQGEAPPPGGKSAGKRLPGWVGWLLVGCALGILLIWMARVPLRCAVDYRPEKVTQVFTLIGVAGALFYAILKSKLAPAFDEIVRGLALGLIIPFLLVWVGLTLFVPDISKSACAAFVDASAPTPTAPAPASTSPAASPTIPAPTPTAPAPTSTPAPVETAPACLRLPPLPEADPYFYIYTDANAADNHFIPSVFMGDVGDITVIEDSPEAVHSGMTAIKIVYDAKGRGGPEGEYHCRLGEVTGGPCKYAGVYWVNPADNIGSLHSGGYNLSGFKKLTFWAMSPEGIDLEFHVGGIGASVTHRPECPDSYAARGRPPLRTLKPAWERYEIVFEQPADLSYLIGGFYWSANWPNNDVTEDYPQKLVFYLDDIRFER